MVHRIFSGDPEYDREVQEEAGDYDRGQSSNDDDDQD